MALASQPVALPELPDALRAAEARRGVEAATGHALSRGDVERRPLLLALAAYWHLLSLDAPTVAVVWAFAFARVFRVEVPVAALALLFAGTWLLYVADRILDGLGYAPGSTRLRERHFFYMRHRRAALVAAVPVTAVLVWLVFARMSPAARVADALIFAVAAVYFGLVHLRGRAIEHWFPKELIVALVAAAAIAVPGWTRLSRHHGALALLAALFAALCWLNCIAIEKWERMPGRKRPLAVVSARERKCGGERNDPTARWGQAHLPMLSAGVAGAALLAGAVFLCAGQFPVAVLCAAAALSAALFRALDQSGLRAFSLRIAADAALLTPVLLLPFLIR